MMPFLSRRRLEKEAAERLYAACLQAARQPGLFTGFGVADTIQGRFEMLALHLFPVLYRLMHAPGDDPALARDLSEAFVNDMDAAFREIGVSDVGVPRRMKALYRSFAGRISAYKEGLEAGKDALAAAVARNVFPDGAAGDSETGAHALALAAYLRAAVEAIGGAELDALRRGSAPFPAPLSKMEADHEQ